MNDFNTYFYGIDYKKMELYCKVKSTHEVSHKYLTEQGVRLKFNSSYYPVITTYHFDEKVEITVDCIRFKKVYIDAGGNKRLVYEEFEDRIDIKIDFANVEFGYFFEDTKEEDLKLDFF